MATKVVFVSWFSGPPTPPSLQNLLSIIGQTKPIPRCPRLRYSCHLSFLTRALARLRLHEIFHPIHTVRIQSKEVHVVKEALI